MARSQRKNKRMGRAGRIVLAAFAALLLFILLLAGIGVVNASVVRVRKAEVILPDLPASFDGTRILYASDIDLCGLNTAAKAYYFPQVENTDLTADDYITLSQNVNIANNKSATVYFYTAPNYCEGNGLHTKFEFTAGGKTGTVDLGSDVPNEHYNLYMNTIYTFNITVK